MKTKVLINIILLIFFFNNSFSQEFEIKVDHSIIYFKNKDSLRIKYFKLKSSGGLIVWKTKKSKKIKYNINNINKIKKVYKYVDKSKANDYINKFVIFKSINGLYKQLDVIVEGKLNLYMLEIFSINANYVYRDYYIGKNDNVKVYFIASKKMSKKRFKRIAKPIFNSCLDLITKINEEKYTHKDIEQIVKIYNNCK